MQEIIGLIKDKVPDYDMRRLYNLRNLIIRAKNEEELTSSEMLKKMSRVLGNSLVEEAVMKFIAGDDRKSFSLARLHKLIEKIEQ